MSKYSFTKDNFLSLSNYAGSMLNESARLSPGEVRDIFYAAAEQVDPKFQEIIQSLKQLSKQSELNLSPEEIAKLTKEKLNAIDYGDMDSAEITQFERAVQGFLKDTGGSPRMVFLLSVIAATQAASSQGMEPSMMRAWMSEIMDTLALMNTGNNESIVSLEEPLNEAIPPLGFFKGLSSIAKHLSHMDPTMDRDAKLAKKHQKSRAKSRLSTDKQILMKFGGLKKGNLKNLDFDSLLAEWERLGRPTDSNKIIKMLKQVGYSNNQIMHIFRKAGVTLQKERLFNIRRKRNDAIAKLASLIYKHGFEELMIKHINTKLLIPVKEDVEEKEGFTDSQLRSIFINAVNLQNKEHQDLSSQEVLKDVSNWAKEIQRSPSDEDKEAAIKKIVNLLADIEKDQEWEQISAKAEKIIMSAKVDPNFTKKAMSSLKMGKIIEHDNYMLATYFLLESGFGWDDFALQPTKIDENKYRLDRTLYGKNVLVEDLLHDAVMLQYIKNSHK